MEEKERKRSDQTPEIKCARNGPYVVMNLLTFTDGSGDSIDTKRSMPLCRCGGTSTKPFCDGTHTRIGFTDEKDPDRVPDRRDNYTGERIIIHDNRGICSHAGHCTDNLPAVFRSGTEPWIDPNGANVDEIIKVVKMCPSGALSYSIDGVEHRDQDREPAVRVTPHGPYRIEGGIDLKDIENLEGTSEEHRTLCRCGHSKNKPFCDGTHWYVNFRDDGLYRIAMMSDLKEDEPLDVEVEGVRLYISRDGEGVSVTNSGGSPLEVKVDERWGEILVPLAEVRTRSGTQDRDGEEQRDGEGQSDGGIREEPHNDYIHELARYGLSRVGCHGPVAAMGVPRYELPCWDDLQIITAQLSRPPLMEDEPVGTDLVIGPQADKPLRLEIPIFVSDMSFGALSEEAKIALARGAELAGTGICSGEGGMLPEEQAENSRYFYEMASARFGFSFEQLDRIQAFHFKCGQGAKTGTGGHLPGRKVTEKIAAIRGLRPGEDAISPSRFPDLETVEDFRKFADRVRARTGGVPVGFKLSAQHIEKDLDAALAAGADYIILDGRGGATGAAPLLFRDNISVPTMPALARARRHLDRSGIAGVTLIITGGLRTPADFVKALALGADGIAIANAAIQAIGCLGSRVCHTNTCPAGIATQDEALRALVDVDDAARRLQRFLEASVQLMCLLARACGYAHLNELVIDDLTTWKRDIAALTGVAYGGVEPL